MLATMRGVPESVSEAFKTLPTPALGVYVPTVVQAYDFMHERLPEATIHYAVKALPEYHVVRALLARGASFDVASLDEFGTVLSAGVSAQSCVVGAPAASRAFLRTAATLGAQAIVVDCHEQLVKVSEVASGAAVAVRIASSDAQHSGWPLGRKFGAQLDDAVAILRRAEGLGLRPVGVTVHPGSQQTNLDAWRHAIMDAGWVLNEVERWGVPNCRWVDLGGGFPVAYRHRVPSFDDVVAVIRESTNHYLPHDVQLAIEPGRVLAAGAGYLRTRVELVTTRGDERWVYTDAGVFHGFAESASPDITLPVARVETLTDTGFNPNEPVIMAGASCDSADIVYDASRPDRLLLPTSLREGDHIVFGMAGAYTSVYTTRFNGLAPLTVTCVEGS